MTRLLQGCSEQGGEQGFNIVDDTQGGDKVATTLFPTSRVMTRLSQPCDNVTLTTL